MEQNNIYIEEDMGIYYQDSGQWRSYEIRSEGSTLEELIDNASIMEVDQNGGEIVTYGIYDSPSNEIEETALNIIKYYLRYGS